MKPSDRILEIWEKLCKDKNIDMFENPTGYLQNHALAISLYLDEQYEASRQCFVCGLTGCKMVHP